MSNRSTVVTQKEKELSDLKEWKAKAASEMEYLRTKSGAAINFPGPLTPQLTLPKTSVETAAQVVAASRVSSPLAQSNPQVAQAAVAGSIAGAMTMEQLQKRKNELTLKIRSFQQKGGRKLKVGAEPPRNKTHWDYVLQEMTWMAADFKRLRFCELFPFLLILPRLFDLLAT